jgi:hypothetical protein
LHPHDGRRYQDLPCGEDTAFIAEHYQNHCVRLDNTDQPELYLRFFRQGNVSSERAVMKGFAHSVLWGEWMVEPSRPGSLPPAAVNYLRDTLHKEYACSRPRLLHRLRCYRCESLFLRELRRRRDGRLQVPPRWIKLWRASRQRDFSYWGVCRYCAKR